MPDRITPEERAPPAQDAAATPPGEARRESAGNAAPPGLLPLLSVVVPAYNEAALLPRTLACLHRALGDAGLGADRYEVVVCDNASTDATALRAREGGARVVREPVRQIARARNAGAAAARGRWLVFMDADSCASPGLIGEMLECMTDGRVAGGGATIAMAGIPLGLRLMLAGWNALSRRARWMAGAFIFCRAEAFRALGGFDETLYAGEEIDLSIRLGRWARGRGEQVRILHRHPLATSARKATLYSRRELLTVFLKMLRHPRRFFRDPALCFPWYDGRR